MASSLLALLDDIATLLDDVSLMSKVAAKKTAGVLGDDLALNAQQVTGVRAERELPVVWAVAKGSLRNKVILVPGALLISAFIPWLITPLLMLGGAFLCYEGFEKLAHRFLHDDSERHAEKLQALSDPKVDLVAFEKDKISGAVRTDFILSAEIVAITLGTVAAATFTTQVLVLSTIALAVTVGVYGLVAGIVKLDDAGLALCQRGSGLSQKLGGALLWLAPWLMKTLSVVGTAAMFMVGGGILTHGFHALGHWIENTAEHSLELPWIGSVLGGLLPTVMSAGVGILAGALIFAVVGLGSRLFRRPARHG
ncbi:MULTISPECIES: DUF808 domain-containing protein [Halopseudomonas]|uniref:DUF808 domain-containing protein n=1 Tax=Halopseudomonas formosensis TaxID=1002526 RepID=A0A1I6BVU8_9GAMM|nr:DUF808 domain-containing protein [Halopseudomonas formosensis]MDX9687805.1 DUF808 domain-containing protein [Halopseudomonas formosensis]SFQ85056.1 hypothetical protein SAMN05216578_10748 [Halopseudomonas formosensis]